MKSKRSAKRKATSDDVGGAAAAAERTKKRRFVWPELLHAQFVSAVFDVGLRCSSAQRIAAAMPRSDVEAVERLLGRYRNARCVNPGDKPAKDDPFLVRRRYDEDEKAEDQAPVVATQQPEPPLAVEIESSAPVPTTQQQQQIPSAVFARSVAIARRQVEIGQKSDELLRKFEARLRQTVQRQRDVVAALKEAKKIEPQLVPDLEEKETSWPRSARHRQQQEQHILPTNQDAEQQPLAEVPASQLPASRGYRGPFAVVAHNGHDNTRSIQFEMESHMSMHREMLLRKTDQLTLFEDAPAPAALDASPWAFDDEELLKFISE
mmetsp:Transcript_8727/g.26832  ORF Transcript_8727/g.26832 Transcript_8727/m.26832 type:complete len:321 (+) Transcript_8727:74-1036(+)